MNAIAVVTRCEAPEAFEPAGEVSLVGEARISGDLSDRMSLAQSCLGFSDPHLSQVSVRRDAYSFFERTHEVVAA